MSACFSLGLGAVEISQEYHNHKKFNFWTGIDLKTHAKLQHLAQIAIPVPAKTLILSSQPSILPKSLLKPKNAPDTLLPNRENLS
ncbi:uncharacterized protein QC761_0015300 [Podospora bellae-mahoneyi]|uniref:Uncharacterized protein n=1 Tax=Podospora bellae-mahoneyi TaxID=2093777 RepID=A0ABR0FZG5_9PEZI|nr:hypothetical protein QC761_0015300 [Podospora bellae-mahoneyi]